MEKARFGILATLLVATLGLVCVLHWDTIENTVNPDKIPEVQVVDNLEPIVEEWSVEDYLQMRDDMRFDKQVDSVFINMPDQILTYILVEKGTGLSVEEIVVEYINNKDKYDNIVKTAMDVQKKYIPDSLPSRAKPDVPNDTPPNVAEK